MQHHWINYSFEKNSCEQFLRSLIRFHIIDDRVIRRGLIKSDRGTNLTAAASLTNKDADKTKSINERHYLQRSGDGNGFNDRHRSHFTFGNFPARHERKKRKFNNTYHRLHHHYHHHHHHHKTNIRTNIPLLARAAGRMAEDGSDAQGQTVATNKETWLNFHQVLLTLPSFTKLNPSTLISPRFYSVSFKENQV